MNTFHREYKGKAPFVGYFEVKTPRVLVIDPDIIKTVMIKSFKNFHDNGFDITEKFGFIYSIIY